MPEESTKRILEGSTEQHGSASVLLLPAIEVVVAITAGAGEVLAYLGVAVGHHATSERPTEPAEVLTESSSHWLAGAKPSKLSRGVPFMTARLILTTPLRPIRFLSSISSRLSNSVS